MGLPQLRVADFYYSILFGSVIGGCLGDDAYIGVLVIGYA